MYHHTKFEPPTALTKMYMNVQSCIMSTIISVNIFQFFRQTNPKNAKIVILDDLSCSFDTITHKREVMFVYLSNTSHFIHFQLVRQKK